MKQIVLATAMAAMMCSLGASAQNKVKNVYTEANQLNVEQVMNTEQTTRVNRYLIAGYNTLCLPMSVTAEQLAANGVTAERLAAIRQEGNTLQLLFVDCTAEGLEAGVPYLINSQKTQYLSIRNTEAEGFCCEAKTIRMSDSQGNQVSFASSWEKREKVGHFGIPAKQNVTPLQSVLVETTSEQSFLPTRCGFNWEQRSATAEKLEIVHASEAEVTAINAVKHNNNATTETYDLQGRKHAAPVKGINIVSGNKVIVK